jgi:nitroimidazol reductase NimA-like FMN-containing flavoprotein (pyridoxamine 5'-phosphate oxidase superfamily)
MNSSPSRAEGPPLETLDEAECLRLLATVPIGRLVITRGGLPAVRLVSFLVDGDSIIFATADDDSRRAAERGDVVAFQVDDVDAVRRTGWSVTTAGHLKVIDAEEAAMLRRTLPVRALATDRQLICLAIENLEGRRVTSRPDD